jgi:glycosyltransferase involved in cell wall biosynthesis
MDKVFFKIVIPNYNGMAYVRQCLDSIFGQTFQDFFVVFADDRSTDLSYEFAKMYERKHPDKMKTIRLDEKKYAGGARNAGIDFPVECEYYYFLDSDDMLASSDSLSILHKNV